MKEKRKGQHPILHKENWDSRRKYQAQVRPKITIRVSRTVWRLTNQITRLF
jgi:hypothetical protein